jgi:hypothetical protein
MRKLSMLAFVLLAAAGLAASVQRQAMAGQAVSVAGKWTMTLETSMGTGTPALELKQEGEKITGTYTGRYGTFALEGTIKGRAIEFAVTMSAEGQSVTVSFAGEVAEDGKSMKGTAVLDQLGEATWSAVKEKAE